MPDLDLIKQGEQGMRVHTTCERNRKFPCLFIE
jgi:hypothetical protein